MSAPVDGGNGLLSAYLFGADVFDGPFTTCGGLNQSMDIMGIVSLSLNGLACPLAVGAPGAVSLSIVVPTVAEGMTIDVILNATLPDASRAFCLNMSVAFA